MPRIVETAVEKWPLAREFAISRSVAKSAVVVVASVREADCVGRGESAPNPRYGESVEATVAAIDAAAGAIAGGMDRAGLRRAMPAGSARNALDCALFDLEAKLSGVSAAAIAGLGPLRSVETAYTLSLDSPEAMAAAAAGSRELPLLKLKLGREGDPARIEAVRKAAPAARLIVDANEGWQLADLAGNLAACAAAGVELVEQPLPAAHDSGLQTIPHTVPICADESLHTTGDLARLAGRYDAVNIKLDKAGGITEALAVAAEARRLGFRVMVGCMLGTSLAMAPAFLVAQGADFVDLDGPLLLAHDRTPGLRYDRGWILPPPPELWG